MPELALESLDFATLVRTGDGVSWGQACAEPTALTRRLLAQRHRIGGFEAFIGIGCADSAQAEHADCVRFSSYCGTGTNRRLLEAGALDILPCHYSQLPALIRSRKIRIDVALLQLSPPDADGWCSLGIAQDYLVAALDGARTVIGEVNEHVPQSFGERRVRLSDLDAFVRSSEAPVEYPVPAAGEIERHIARRVAALIVDGDTLQLGIGMLPELILGELGGHRDLGIHSGAIGDGVAALMASGTITNARKPIDPGVSVAGTLIGTRRLFEFAHRNPALALRSSDYTHSPDTLARIENLVAINAALEVDLTGQVNAEIAGGRYVGAVGGALDFIRGAARASDGRAIVVLPSMARSRSRIVARLEGVVSTPRADAPIIVTEHGVADLRGATLSQRIERMLAIAHPDARAALEREAASIPGSINPPARKERS